MTEVFKQKHFLTSKTQLLLVHKSLIIHRKLVQIYTETGTATETAKENEPNEKVRRADDRCVKIFGIKSSPSPEVSSIVMAR